MTSPQKDRFAHDRLPPAAQWPEMIPLDGVPQNEPLNCTTFLLDAHLAAGTAGHPAILSGERRWTYGELAELVARIAALMTTHYGIEPGNRVLIRGANSPEVAAIWLAIQKVGAVAVTTMSLLRAGELATIIAMSEPALAFCEASLADELVAAVGASGKTLPIVRFGAEAGELYSQAADLAPLTQTCPTLADDISLIAFTSGTTGLPKATMHFHRDVLAICRTVCRHIVRPRPTDIFIGTAPLAFTFGLGGLLVFPLFAGATTVLNARYTPQDLLVALRTYKATICFTVPTFYQQMLHTTEGGMALPNLRKAICSGEALALPTRTAWHRATGLHLTEVLGSTEMLHAFAGSTPDALRPGFIGPAIPGYQLAILDDGGNPLPPGEIGRLAVRGPTGCRYLDDPRQADYVQHGWNLTGDACTMSEDGYIAYHTRYDDMIISSGYNISGLEVENALLEHPRVAECAVIGEPDPTRGQIVAAHVVLKAPTDDLERVTGDLQAHVKAAIAPYKYPRKIHFTTELPRNESGKIQRFRLRQ